MQSLDTSYWKKLGLVELEFAENCVQRRAIIGVASDNGAHAWE